MWHQTLKTLHLIECTSVYSSPPLLSLLLSEDMLRWFLKECMKKESQGENQLT